MIFVRPGGRVDAADQAVQVCPHLPRQVPPTCHIQEEPSPENRIRDFT